MAGRPSGHGNGDSDDRGGLFGEGAAGGYGVDSTDPGVLADPPDDGGDLEPATHGWYKPPGSSIGPAPGPAPSQTTGAPPPAAASSRGTSSHKLAQSDSTHIAMSPLLAFEQQRPGPGPTPPQAGDLTRPVTIDDTPPPYESPERTAPTPAPPAPRLAGGLPPPPAPPSPSVAAPPAPPRSTSSMAIAMQAIDYDGGGTPTPADVSHLPPMEEDDDEAIAPAPMYLGPAPKASSDATFLLDDARPPIASPRSAAPTFLRPTPEPPQPQPPPISPLREAPISAPMPSRPLGGDATMMLTSNADSTRISMGPLDLASLGVAAPKPKAGPRFGASKEERSKVVARGAGGSNEGATRMMMATDLPAPVWRPAEIQRHSSAPDTMAWEQEEGTVARLVSSLKVLTGGKAEKATRRADASATPATPAAQQLRDIPFLGGLDGATLDGALASGAISMIERGRDVLIDVEGAAFLITEGQLSLGRFDKAKLDEERKIQAAIDPSDKKAAKKEAKRRMEAGPLIRVATENVAFFEKGDVVHLKDFGAPPGMALGAWTVTPVVGVSIRNDLLDQLSRQHTFFADRVRRATKAAKGRIEAVGGARTEVADFFIRHGLSVSQVLRVRAIDMCIECGACEQACEDRYGAKRLSLGGRKLGTLDFVDACHTCTDQRCIDPCAFDAIKYDTDKKEVVIIEAACTGCTLCATACPYAAIEMHDFEDKPLLKIRLDKQNKLGFGDTAPPIVSQFGPIKARKAKSKRIASKCDHCVDYEDQACISACPTGALVDVEPGDVFAARSADILEQADDGYDHSRIIDVAALNDPRIFQMGMSSKQAQGMDKARAVRRQVGTTWMWVVGLTAFVVAFAEILLRKWLPERSLDFLYATMVEGMEKEIALDRVDFHAGGKLALWFGYVGSVLMFSGLLYPARRRVPAFKNMGSQRGWFDIHVLTGVIGPLFVSLHTAAKLDTWVSAAVWAMVLTAISGAAGRYLFTQIPEWSSAASLLARDAVGTLDELRPRHPGVRALDNWFLADQKRVEAAAAMKPTRITLWLLGEWLRRLPLRLDLRQRVIGVVDAKARREAVRAAMLLGKYERHKVLLPKIEPLCRTWKVVHVPAAILLTVLGGIHIVISLLQ